jgi:DNA-nicking Smr family endonuclease
VNVRGGSRLTLLLASCAMNAHDDDKDAQLFRDAIGRVRPLKRDHAPVPDRPRPPPVPAQYERDEARVRDELLVHDFDPAAIELGDEIHYLKPGQPQRLLKRLRRGQFSVRAELDLHEMTTAVAREAIRGFLDESIAQGDYCVRIVHGKGLRSRAQGPVLKRLTATMLARRKDVIAYASARPAQGGTGAVLVLLHRA